MQYLRFKIKKMRNNSKSILFHINVLIKKINNDTQATRFNRGAQPFKGNSFNYTITVDKSHSNSICIFL